jgi:hypothetical protein
MAGWRGGGVVMKVKPMSMLLMMLAGWLNRHQQDVIEYLREENDVLRERIGTKRILATRVGLIRVFVGDVLEEQQDENVILVLAGIHAAPKLVTALPERRIEFRFLKSYFLPSPISPLHLTLGCPIRITAKRCFSAAPHHQ